MRILSRTKTQLLVCIFLILFLFLPNSAHAFIMFPMPLPAPSPPEIFGLKKKFEIRLAASQVSYTNWAAGGENSLSYSSFINNGIIKNTKLYNMQIQGKFAFGQTKIGHEHVRNSLDKIEIEASGTLKKQKFLNPFVSFQLLTQFTTGYDYSKSPPVAKSGFWDPAFLTQSMGSGVKFTDYLSTRMGLALKETFTRLYPRYSDNPKTKNVVEHLRVEKGINSQTNLKLQFNKNVNMVSKLQLFYNMRRLKDVDWRFESQINSKLARYFSVNFNLYLMYDRDITTQTQIKQALSMGFTYNFF